MLERKLNEAIKATYVKANFAHVVMLSNVKLKIEESREIFSLANRTNKFGPSLSDLLLLDRSEADVTDKASVVEEDVLA